MHRSPAFAVHSFIIRQAHMAWTFAPPLPMAHSLVSSHRASAFQFPKWIGRQRKSCTTTSVRRLFSGLQSFPDVQALGLTRHPGRSHRQSGSLDPLRGGRDFYIHAYLGSFKVSS